MQTSASFATTPSLAQTALRIVAMLGVVALLIALSIPSRQMPVGRSATILINILFFIALGVADQLLIAPVLDRIPLARAAFLVLSTLALGWFFSPGRVTPASKILFFVHILPFFAAVFGGALAVIATRWLLQRR